MPAEFLNIHRRLFYGIYKFAGKIRDYNITKSEWVLDGATVLYAAAPLIKETLEYDFREEKNFKYKGLTKQEQVEHIAKFVSGLWQIHAFGEGNTRTTAVFAIKYLRNFGFKVENDMFVQNSWYFRNALVRANYNDHTNNIYATTKYLNLFFDNLLFGENNILKNRYLHIKFVELEKLDVNDTVKPQHDTSNVGEMSEKCRRDKLKF
jgi:fido (protein-threonine AMPylation protein)